MAEAGLRFRAPARYDDVLALEVQVVDLGRTSLTTTVDVMLDGEALVEGRLRHVIVDAGTWGKTDIPSWVCEGLEGFVAT